MGKKKNFALSAVIYGLLIYGTISVSGDKIAFLDINDNPLVNIANENPTPIVGILAQEVSKYTLDKYPNKNYTSYIAASYVKFVEGAGGRAVPIMIGKDRDYYEDILSKINGVLLPGGATYFNQSNGYADAGRHIYELAIEMNNNGTYFPVWGTCLGFELLVYLSANSSDPRSLCFSQSQALPLEFTDNYEKSRMFRDASFNILEILGNYPVTANFHKFCFTRETFANMKLDQLWDVTSLGHDWNDLEFIATIEHKKYPFYGTQFHPEKNLYEFIPNRNITHTRKAIEASQYFANFFIDETRRNQQKFNNESEEMYSLFYNYIPVYTGLKKSSFEQQYFFEYLRSSANHIVKFNILTIIFSLIIGLGIYKLFL